MEVSTFFTRLLAQPKPAVPVHAPDSLPEFDAAWTSVKETLEHPDERQLVRGIGSTDVPRNLKYIVDALVYEANRTDEDTTGACLEYFLRHDMLAQLERLCERDRPHGIKAEVIRAVNNLVVLLPERFLVHNAVHRPLRRLLRNCVVDTPIEKVDGEARVLGAAANTDSDSEGDGLDEELVDLMCILASRMRAYPPLLLIFFHDRGWMIPHNSSGAPQERTLSPSRALSPTPSALTANTGKSDQSTATNTHFEFFLFAYLLRYVHREGRTGDFARAGLLFLFDIAFLPPSEEGGDTIAMTPGVDGSDPLQDARDSLAEYILDGDFADVMAAGLGASYSVLPTKLRVPSLAEQARADPDAASSGGLHLGATNIRASVDEDDEDAEDAEDYHLALSTDLEIRAQLDLLLKLFGFLQDILHRCRSPLLHADPTARVVSSMQVVGPAVADSTLDAVQTAFVDNVLYPSILECSSTDGSAVAVLTYLDVLLSNLEDGPVLHRILDVLMDTNSAAPAFASPQTKKERRKTGAMGFVTGRESLERQHDYYANAGRFTLRDLVLDNIRSGSGTSATAALHLLQTLLGDHCRRVTPAMLTVVRDPVATAVARRPLPPPDVSDWPGDQLPPPVNAADAHLQEPELYSALVPRLDDAVQGNDVASGLASYLTDAHAFLEADGCWLTSHVPLQFVSDDGKPALLRVGEYDMDPLQHSLSPTDPLMREMLNDLRTWFINTPDANVALTGALSALLRCPHRSVAGLLLYDMQTASDPWAGAADLSDADSDISLDERKPPASRDEEHPFRAKASTLPALYQILRELVRHTGRFRGTVRDFDRLLSERRKGLLFADHLEEAMGAMLDGLVAAPAPAPVAASPLLSHFGMGSPTSSPVKKPSGGGLASSIRSLWSPRPKRSGTSTPTPGTPSPKPAAAGAESNGSVGSPRPPSTPAMPTLPSSPVRSPRPASTTASSLQRVISPPMNPHYTQVSQELVDVSAVQAVSTGPWAPVRDSATCEDGEEDAAPGTPAEDELKHTRRSLTSVLDNCIVLEELVKELVALITARRAMGIDQVGFV